MKQSKLMILIFFLAMIFSCQREKNPVTPPIGGNIHPQVDIPWPSLADSPWPMHHHDPQSTGRSPYIGPQQGKLVWKKYIGYSIGTSIAIGPDSTIYFGSDGPFLWALNWNGTVKWKLSLSGGSGQANSPLVSSDNIIYIGTRRGRLYKGILYAVNPDGTVKWKYEANSGINNLGLNIGLDGTIYFTDHDFYLNAVSPEGKLRWRIGHDYKYNGVTMTGIALSPDGSTLYLGCLGSAESDTMTGLIAVGIDGTVKWLFKSFPAYGTPLVDNAGNIYFGARKSSGLSIDSKKRGIFSITDAGKLRWHYSAQMGGMMDPAMDYNGNIYFTTEDSSASFALISFDNDGNLRWKYTNDAFSYIASSLLCDSEGTIYLSTYGTLAAFTSDGNLKWKTRIGNIPYVSPALAYGRLFFGTGYHDFGLTFYCYN